MDLSMFNRAKGGEMKAVARCISFIENEVSGYEELLRSLNPASVPVIGITGPPGAGKSTITDGLIGALVEMGKKIAVLCVDPSSPFHYGALLGDRVRMNRWYLHELVFIRSFASRGSLGGLNPRIIEIIEFLKSTGYDLIVVETVGVGQSEVDIAGLADFTVVVLVPEAGDDVQAMKAGLMEVADLFVVNKSDRPDAKAFTRNLRAIIPPDGTGLPAVRVLNTIATTGDGLSELANLILSRQPEHKHLKSIMYAEQAYQLIQAKRMKGVDKKLLQMMLKKEMGSPNFNLYRFVEKHFGT